MQIYQKNKIDFITGMVWQKSDEEHKVSLKQMKTKCGFNFYCKTNKIITTYGFVKLNLHNGKSEDNTIKKKKIKLKKPTSLGLFIVNALEVNKETEDLFICFRFNENLFGYLLLYKATIFPYEGEFIGTEYEVKAKISKLAAEYNIKTAKIFEDVPFFNSSSFINETGLKVIVIKSFFENNKILGASDYYLWQNKSFKSIVRNSQIEPITLLKKKYKTVLISLLIISGAVLINELQKSYYKNLDNLEALQNSMIDKTNIFVNDVGVDAKTFIDSCFSNIDRYINPINNWQIDSLNCNLKGTSITYKTENGTLAEIKAAINDKGLIIGDKTARLNKSFDLTKIQPNKSYQPYLEQIENLKVMADKYGLLIKINGLKKIEVSSSLSPIFLYNNNIINNINILEISMQLNSDGFFNWVIRGELNGR
ncbi:MAG TPA: hypothetical protein PKD00_02140 [Burkholderiales bacterium]|nr:hypothetical protein [Burkholderiales bacterium]